MKDYNPGYLQLAESGELRHRSILLNERLQNCTICPHHCEVNRLEGERGFCQAGADITINSYGPHFGEEDVLIGRRGSGTIFFSNCNLQCVFCQNYQLSHEGKGYEISPSELAKIMLSLQTRGCHNINLVSPSHFVPQIVDAVIIAIEEGLTLPLVYNTGGYDEMEVLQLLDGIIDIYMPDIKFGNNERAEKYTKAIDYFDLTRKAVKEMYRQVGDLKLDDRDIAYKGLLIRHLVMPNNLANTNRILDFVAQRLSKKTAINIMDQYYPAYQANSFPELRQRVSRREYHDAIDYAKGLGLYNFL